MTQIKLTKKNQKFLIGLSKRIHVPINLIGNKIIGDLEEHWRASHPGLKISVIKWLQKDYADSKKNK